MFTVALTAAFAIQGLSPVTGLVYADRNANGVRDAGEPGLPGVVISDQVNVMASGTDGSFRLDPLGGFGVVYVSVPDGYRAVGPFWRSVDSSAATRSLQFGLTPAPLADGFTFIHASDTHMDAKSRPRTERLRALIDSIRPAFVLVSGDLIRDALRVPEPEARGYYEMYRDEMAKIPVPVWSVPGNHEIFGIERHLSLVSPKHPLYGRRMYRHYLGPDYYSFNAGGIHFIAVNSVDIDDLWYFGRVDSVQMAWLERDVASIPPSMPVITFNHIPLVGTSELWRGFTEEPPAPTLIKVRGRTLFRHVVSNAREVLAMLRSHPYPLALGGHYHQREVIKYEMGPRPTQFHLAAAVVGPTSVGDIRMTSGISVYRVRGGKPDDGTFVPLGLDPLEKP